MATEDRWGLEVRPPPPSCTPKGRYCKDTRHARVCKLRLHRLDALDRLLQVVVLSLIVRGVASQQAPALGPGQSFGVLAEYYLENPHTCLPGNGSFGVFDHLVPNMTRKEEQINWPNRLSFKIQRCTWQKNVFDDLKYSCAGFDVTTNNMAVRWSGYIYILTSGMYEFELDVDDGARLTIGHGRCPGITCGSFTDTMNVDLREEEMLETSSQGADANQPTVTYAKQCSLCATGVYGDCFVTSNGCEPFSAWTLEGDSATKSNPNSCNTGGGARIYRGKKYMQAGQHPFKMEYFQRGGDARAILRWKGPDSGMLWAPIRPYSLVYPNFDGMKAEWFEMPVPEQGDTDQRLSRYFSPMGDVINGRKVLYQDYAMQDVRPQRTEFGSAISFSDLLEQQTRITVIRFLGWIRILNEGTYEFRLESDDGSRLILGGQGTRREQIIVDNDGNKERLLSKTGSTAMLKGLHSIRIEYLYIPGYAGVLPSAPGIIFEYKGPDTGGAWLEVQSKGFNALRSNNAGCDLSRWAWSLGSQYTSDCTGECFDAREWFVGDGKCDRGPPSLQVTLNLVCPQWNNDNTDCSPEFGPLITTRTPGINCYVTCPAGDWKRNSCAKCLGEELNDACIYNQVSAPDCVPTAANPDKCNYRFCCTAKLESVFGWGKDCIQFGAATNCTHALSQILLKMANTPWNLYEQAASRTTAIPLTSGNVLSAEPTPLKNPITQGFVKNPYTGFDTQEKICPVGESGLPGIECYEGPWDLTGLKEPLTECQGGQFEDNFCVNRKTFEGMPFQTCCTFAWMNSQGNQECRFLGLPFGSCGDWVQAYQSSVAVNSFTRISNPLVIFSCNGDKCNDPRPNLDANNIGCVSVLNTAPWQTDLLRTRAPGSALDEDMLFAAPKESKPEEFPTAIVICSISGVLALCIGACVTYKAMQRPPPPIWHSEKAIVVSNDTWIEPVRDQFTNKEYGVVEPRSFAFLSVQQYEKPKLVPKALRVDPLQIAVAEEAVHGTIEKQLRFEDDVQNCRVHSFLPEEHLRRAALEDQKKSHATHLQQQLEERHSVPAELRDHSVPHLPQVVHMPDPFKERTWALQDEEEVEDLESADDQHRAGSKRAPSKDPRASSKTPADWRRGSCLVKPGAIFSYAIPDDELDDERYVPESIPDSIGDPRLQEFTVSAVISKPPAAARNARKGKGKGSTPLVCT